MATIVSNDHSWWRRLFVVVLFIGAWILGAGPARADERARAQQLFDSALGDIEAGRYAEACPKFAASQAADPKTSTLLNLGSCYENLGRVASAWGAFREAEGLARRAGRSDMEASARERAEALTPKLIRLTIVVPDAVRVPGLTVSRDGSKLTTAEWGIGIPIDEGDHEIVVEAPQRKPRREHIVVQRKDMSIEVGPLEVAATPPSVREAPPVSWWTPMRKAGVVTVGVGAAGFVTGMVLAVIAKSNYDSARDQCDARASDACPASSVISSDNARSLATVGTVVLLSGAVVGVAGGALVLLAPSNKPRTTGLRTSLTAGLGTIGVSGRW